VTFDRIFDNASRQAAHGLIDPNTLVDEETFEMLDPNDLGLGTVAAPGDPNSVSQLP
jgi:hypothetical protein